MNKTIENILNINISLLRERDIEVLFGSIIKSIGDNIFVSPIDKEIKHISYIKDNGNIIKIGFTLNFNVSLSELQTFLNHDPIVNYDHYDDLSFFVFNKNQSVFSFIAKGYYEKRNNEYFFGNLKILENNILFDEISIQKNTENLC